jgi:hypothetical protein
LHHDVLTVLACLRVATRGDQHTRVVGHMSHDFAVANGVGPEAARAVVVGQRWGHCYNRGVEDRIVVGQRVNVQGVRRPVMD